MKVDLHIKEFLKDVFPLVFMYVNKECQNAKFSRIIKLVSEKSCQNCPKYFNQSILFLYSNVKIVSNTILFKTFTFHSCDRT